MRTVRSVKLMMTALAVGGVLAVSACSGPAADSDDSSSGGSGSGSGGGTVTSASSADLAGPASKEGKLVWYSSLVRPAADAIKKAFETEYPDIDVELFQAGGSQIIAKVESEELAGKVRADVIDYSESAAVISEAQRGLFLRYQPPNVDEIAAPLKGKNGDWFSPFYVTATIVYNSDKVSESEAPTSWQDLTDPKWKGKVGMASPDYAGTAVATVATWKQNFGDDYLKKLGANGMTVFESFGNVHDALLSGQTPVAVSLSFRAIPSKAQGQPINWITPKQGQIVLDLPAAISKDAAHPNAAKLFANFLLSEDTQTMLAKDFGYFPALTKVAQAAGLPDTSGMKLMKSDLQEMADPKYVANVKAVFKAATS
jgi:iron(III) transport system substrate-binding protein